MVGNRRKGEERFVGVSRADTSRAIETERRIVNYAAARHPVQLLFPFSSILERSSSSVCARYARWKGKKRERRKRRGGRSPGGSEIILHAKLPGDPRALLPLCLSSTVSNDSVSDDPLSPNERHHPLRSCSISSLSISSDRFRVQYFLKMEKDRFSRGRDRRVEVGWI